MVIGCELIKGLMVMSMDSSGRVRMVAFGSNRSVDPGDKLPLDGRVVLNSSKRAAAECSTVSVDGSHHRIRDCDFVKPMKYLC